MENINQNVNQPEKQREEKNYVIDDYGQEWDKDEYDYYYEHYIEINQYYSGLGQNEEELENNGIEPIDIREISLSDRQELAVEDTIEDYIWDVDKSGEIISKTVGSATKEVYQNLEQQGKIPHGLKGAVDMTKTARQLVNNLGKQQGSAMVAENKDYKIGLEANDNLTIISKENNLDIVVANQSEISFQYEHKDLEKFQEYSQELNKEQDKER